MWFYFFLTGNNIVLRKSSKHWTIASTMVLPRLATLIVFVILPLNLLQAVQLKEVQLGATVDLKCDISFYKEIYWLKMSDEQPLTLMVLSLKHNGDLSVILNYNGTNFEGFMEKQVIGLRILQVSTSDLATYHCATFSGKRLDFDKGVQLIVNNTNQQHTEEPSDHVQGPDGLSLHYQVFAAVLCFGLLGMLLAVFLVHIKARQKENLHNEE